MFEDEGDICKVWEENGRACTLWREDVVLSGGVQSQVMVKLKDDHDDNCCCEHGFSPIVKGVVVAVPVYDGEPKPSDRALFGPREAEGTE